MYLFFEALSTIEVLRGKETSSDATDFLEIKNKIKTPHTFGLTIQHDISTKYHVCIFLNFKFIDIISRSNKENTSQYISVTSLFFDFDTLNGSDRWCVNSDHTKCLFYLRKGGGY